MLSHILKRLVTQSLAVSQETGKVTPSVFIDVTCPLTIQLLQPSDSHTSLNKDTF